MTEIMLLSQHIKQIGKREWIGGHWQRTDANGLTHICFDAGDITPQQLVRHNECQACRDNDSHTEQVHHESVLDFMDEV